jgi:hypothetical protein
MRGPQAVRHDRLGVLFPATSELTDAEILERYGPLLEGAVSAFRDDPTYLIHMAESAALMRAKRAKRAG